MATQSRKAPQTKKPTPVKAPAARSKAAPLKKEPVTKPPPKPTSKKPPVKPTPIKPIKPVAAVAVKPKTVQNFTVTSPPAQRKNEPDEPELSPPVSRERKMTRTLDPSESFLANLNLINSSRLNVGPEVLAVSPTEVKPPIVVAKPVAFEIPLETKQAAPAPALLPPAALAPAALAPAALAPAALVPAAPAPALLPPTAPAPAAPPPAVADENTVEDDYDDDFESYESDFEDCPSSEEDEDDQIDEDDETAPTSSSVTTLASSSKSSSSAQQPPPAVEFKITSTVRSDQCQTRGQAILSKISLDDLTYSLLELAPTTITFGFSHTSMQVHCQTDSFLIDKMVETETHGRSTKWTQTQAMEAAGEALEESSQPDIGADDIFQESLKLCAKAHSKYGDHHFVERAGIDPTKLERFLRRGCFVVRQIQKSRNRFSEPSDLPMGQGKATLKVDDFPDLKGSKLTSMTTSNVTLITVHEDADARSLIALWDLNGCHQLASCIGWTPINCVALPNLHTLIAGTVTGSLVLWDPLDDTQRSSLISPSQIQHLSSDFMTSYGIIRTIKYSKSPRLKVYCLHEHNYLTVWIVLKSGGNGAANTTITCDLGYVAPNCHQRLTYVSGVSLNENDTMATTGKSRFSKVLHCFDNEILQDQVLQKLITNETAVTSPSDSNRRNLVTDLLVDGKTVALVTDRSFLFNGFSTSSGKKTKVWLGSGKTDTVDTCFADHNGVIVAGTKGLSTVKFRANGDTIERELTPSMGRLVRSKTILQANGDSVFRIVGQELECVAKDGRTVFSMKNCVDLQLWRKSPTKSLLVLQMANGQIEVHQCDLVNNK